MSVDANVAPAGGGEQPVAPAASSVAERETYSVSEAASLFRRRRDEQMQADRAAEPAAESASQEADTAPAAEQAPGENEATEPAERPLIEPPRSWTKEEKDRFRSLPRETQEYLAERETEREREIRRLQNESADERRRFSAEAQRAQQAKQYYEQQIPSLLQAVQTHIAGEFSDIRSVEDAERLAREDWPRWVQWKAAQDKLQAIQAHHYQAQQQRQAQYVQQLKAYQAEQDEKFVNKVPDARDPVKAAQIAQKVKTYLVNELGMTEQQIMWRWQNDPVFRSFESQKALYDATMLADARARLEKAKADKPVPQVQRPGTAPARGERASAEIEALTEKLNKTGDMRVAAELLKAKNAARRRA